MGQKSLGDQATEEAHPRRRKGPAPGRSKIGGRVSRVEGARSAKAGGGGCFPGSAKKTWIGWSLVNRKKKKKTKVTVPLWGKVPTYNMFFKLREYFWSLKSSVYLLGLLNL